VTYNGSYQGETGYLGVGGTFTYTGTVGGLSEIVIQGPGSTDFNPDNPLNRRILSPSQFGVNSITWDGKSNVGVDFPVNTSTGYPYRVFFHAGEYHFPMIDVENSPNGGPIFTLLNPPSAGCPWYPSGCTTGDIRFPPAMRLEQSTPRCLALARRPPTTATWLTGLILPPPSALMGITAEPVLAI